MSTQTILWRAEQVCGECGEGAFFSTPNGAECAVCQHIHTMDRWNLAEGERFEWHTPRGGVGPTLHVVAYDVTEEA